MRRKSDGFVIRNPLSRLSLFTPPPSADPLERSQRFENLKSISTLRADVDGSACSLPSPERQRTQSTSTSSASATVLRSPDLSIDGQADFGLGEGFDTFSSQLRFAVPDLTVSSPIVDHTKPPTGPALTQALMQASHAECEPGTTADLFSIVLRRDKRAPAFSYTDLKHPCKVWWGAEDEKISGKSMRWMERAIGAELRVVQGEGHNLMTCAGVMVEVFNSLAREMKGT